MRHQLGGHVRIKMDLFEILVFLVHKMSNYYLITVKSLESRIYGPAPTDGYVHASNGVEVPKGISNPRFGIINIAENNLKPCTKQQAEMACWDVLGVRPDSSWDIYNRCYRIDMKDMDGNIVTPKPMAELVKNMKFSLGMAGMPCSDEDALNVLHRYFEKNGFSIINV
jgi:hypothetical protein